MITPRGCWRALLPACALATIAAAGGCAGGIAPRQASEATFIVMRHAEKAADAEAPRDPPLSAAGAARARALAERVSAVPLVAVYATPWRRTRETATPAANAHGLAVRTEDPPEDAVTHAHALRARHRDGTVLVVGHSNTVPPLVAALCGCAVPALGDADYGDLFVVEPDDAGDGAPRLRRERVGE